VIEGQLSAADDAGIAVRGRGSQFGHLGWDDITAARLAVEI